MELDEGAGYTGFAEAVKLVRDNTGPVGIEERTLENAAGYVCADDLCSRVDNPPRHASQKDGYAVRSVDVTGAKPDNPRTLTLVGSVFAGGEFSGVIRAGQAVRVCTGAPIPAGADAIVASEFSDEEGDQVQIRCGIRSGQNISQPGENLAVGAGVAEKGTLLMPSKLSLLAVAGFDKLNVYRKPRFGVLSIGDELTLPGRELKTGQIYASNLVYNRAWMALLNLPYRTAVAPDDAAVIKEKVFDLLETCDAVITSGGVMHSERDMIVGVLEDLGWDMKFRHVRIGPGKATAFGLVNDKPVFCFSGGPGSNALSFLQFALPGIYNMLGLAGEPLRTVQAELTEDIRTRNVNWTEFRDAGLVKVEGGGFKVTPREGKNRMLAAMEAECFVVKPEGTGKLEAGQVVTVQVLPGMTGESGQICLP